MSTATQRQLRRGTAAQIAAATPASGELWWATDTKQLFVGDGSTVGGNLVAMESSVGSWTPALSFGSGAVGMTYATQSGSYMVVGNRVHVQGAIILSAKGSSTGGAGITGLPFANAGTYANVSIYGDVLSSITGGLQGYVGLASSQIIPFMIGTGSSTQLTNANFNNSSQLIFSAVYQK